MPTTTVFLDDDNNVVDRDVASFAVETETDDQGLLVEERWLRVIRPESPEAELIEIVRDSQRLAASSTRGGAKRMGDLSIWFVALFAALLLMFVIRRWLR